MAITATVETRTRTQTTVTTFIIAAITSGIMLDIGKALRYSSLERFAISEVNLKIAMKTKVFAALIIGCLMTGAGFSQTAVILAPLPVFQSFLQNGKSNAFGCVFTYASQTTTPLASYTDSTGTTLNQNPVVLSAGGAANIWIIAGQSYTLVIKSSGGVNCVSGSTVSTVNGIGGGGSVQTTAVIWSSTPTFIVTAQNQLFTMTLQGNTASLPLSVVGIVPPAYISFQITQDGTGGHTFAWPSNSIGGCTIGANADQVTTQMFIWNGAVAVAIGPCVTGNGPNISTGSISATGNISATGSIAATGAVSAASVTAPIINATTGYQISGSYGTSGQFLKSTGTGTAFATPFPVTQYSQNGTLQSGLKMVTGAVILSGGTATMTMTGAAVFSGSYQCWGNDITAANAVSAVTASSSTVTVTGTSTDHIQITCLGF